MLKAMKGGFYFSTIPNHGAGLSKRGLWLRYDARHKHLINAHNKCLDIWHGSNRSGARLVWWNCHGGQNQKFNLPKMKSRHTKKRVHHKRHHKRHYKKHHKKHHKRVVKSSIIHLITPKNHRVVDIWYGRYKRHQKTVLWDRHGGDNQKFRVIIKGKDKNRIKFQLKTLHKNYFMGATGHASEFGLVKKPTLLEYWPKTQKIKHNGKCLDQVNKSFNRGTRIIWYKCQNI
jgi:hypothetical protein